MAPPTILSDGLKSWGALPSRGKALNRLAVRWVSVIRTLDPSFDHPTMVGWRS